MGELTTPKPKLRVEVDGAVVDVDTAKEVGFSLRRAGEEEMQKAALYESKGQWGACSSYLRAAALLTKAGEWWSDADPGFKLVDTAQSEGKRACDHWYR